MPGRHLDGGFEVFEEQLSDLGTAELAAQLLGDLIDVRVGAFAAGAPSVPNFSVTPIRRVSTAVASELVGLDPTRRTSDTDALQRPGQVGVLFSRTALAAFSGVLQIEDRRQHACLRRGSRTGQHVVDCWLRRS
jgi:hypothetical protein